MRLTYKYIVTEKEKQSIFRKREKTTVLVVFSLAFCYNVRNFTEGENAYETGICVLLGGGAGAGAVCLRPAA
jgi:hypothetical protein